MNPKLTVEEVSPKTKTAITLAVVFIVAFIVVRIVWTPNGTVFLIAL